MLTNPKHQKFVDEYLASGNATDAYRRAGFKVTSDASAASAANRLLRSVKVAKEIHDRQTARAEKADLTADWVVQQFVLVYTRAMEKGDHSAATRALENLGKHLGIFETHNRQKHHTPEDMEAIRKRLIEAGMSFERVNEPPVYSSANAPVNRLPSNGFSAN